MATAPEGYFADLIGSTDAVSITENERGEILLNGYVFGKEDVARFFTEAKSAFIASAEETKSDWTKIAESLKAVNSVIEPLGYSAHSDMLKEALQIMARHQEAFNDRGLIV